MFDTNELRSMKGLMNALVQRQQVLSNNLENIETKNYVRQDIDFGKVLSELKNAPSASGDGNESLLARARYRDYSKPMTLESEMSKLYENHLRYLLMTKAISHHFEHMKKALEVRAT